MDGSYTHAALGGLDCFVRVWRRAEHVLGVFKAVFRTRDHGILAHLEGLDTDQHFERQLTDGCIPLSFLLCVGVLLVQFSLRIRNFGILFLEQQLA